MGRGDRVRWKCPDRNCNTWFLGPESGEGTAPLCICGRTMQKEQADLFRYLNFLKEAPPEAEIGAGKG